MKLTLSNIRKIVLIIILALSCGFAGFRLGENNATKGQGKVIVSQTSIFNKNPENIDFSLFWDVWQRLQDRYLRRKELDPQKMFYGAISGMVASLGDPYTVFLPPSDNKDAKDDLRGDFEGVGIQIGYKDQRIIVIAPLDKTPAQIAGVKAGDFIIHITDEKNKIDKDTFDMTLPDAVKYIRGPKGSFVKITVQRDGVKDPLVFNLKRETIVVKSVELEFKQRNGKKVAVLNLSRFGERTKDEWLAAVDEIIKEEENSPEFAGVVLDLRNNPGGFLQGAVFIGSEFVLSGVVVKQDSGVGREEEYPVDRKGSLLKEPLVALINKGSASASEIVAGFLQETKRAKIVGETSFGKGTIQEAEDLTRGAGLHITIARWLLPSGKSIDKEGIKPDIEVLVDQNDTRPDRDLQLDKAIEILTN